MKKLTDIELLAQSIALFRSAYIKNSMQTMPEQGTVRFLILACNYAGGNGIKPNQAAEYFHCSRAYISKTIQSLHRKSLVEKRPDPDDKRACFITCTPKGKMLVHTMMSEYIKTTEKLYQRLGPEKSRLFRELLDEVIITLEKTD